MDSYESLNEQRPHVVRTISVSLPVGQPAGAKNRSTNQRWSSRFPFLMFWISLVSLWVETERGKYSTYFRFRMAPAMATGRLRKELVKLQKDPPPGVIAEPDESNILKWHYAVRGPSDTNFDGGVYIGKLVFPSEYPMKPPGIMMLTPSGRFKVNTRLCLSMSDFHPESWNPMWSVATIIQGVQSFMASDELTTGGIKSPASEHRRLAAASIAYNRQMFPNLFGGDMEAAFQTAY